MNIVFHLGAHCTDGGLLIRSLLQNRARLAEVGVGVPGPLAYREVLGETSTRLRGEAAADDEALILDCIAPDPATERVILSNDNFLCRAGVALGADCLYPKAAKSAWLRQCLPSHQVEFAFALRNPAGFLPDLLSGRAGQPPGDEVLADGLWLDDLKWSDVVRRIAQANPGCPITLWCHEDTPFIWPDIQRALTGVDDAERLEGELDMVETIMSAEGYARLEAFLGAREVSNPTKRHRAIVAFLEAHAMADAIEDEIDLPGWTEETVATLTGMYETDVERIAGMPGVTFLTP
ncbi:MAG: hypothetical protein HKN98_11330 [Silicimonas sp.]|nr:hypothetical protein [Silicimonas sp.]